MAESANRVVLVTGCSSGIGLVTAVHLAKDEQKRFKVYATMRNLGKKEALEKEGGEALGQTLFIEKLDVSSEEQISQVIDDIIKKEGRLDILGMYPNFPLFLLSTTIIFWHSYRHCIDNLNFYFNLKVTIFIIC